MWPEMRELHSRDISMLFHMIVNKTVDVDESMMFIRDLLVLICAVMMDYCIYYVFSASSSRRAFVNDRYIIRLATRTIHEQGVEAAQRMLTSFRNMFLSQSRKYLIFHAALANNCFQQRRVVVVEWMSNCKIFTL